MTPELKEEAVWDVTEIKDPAIRSATCRVIIEKLPDWFGIPDANAHYVDGVAASDAFVTTSRSGTAHDMLSLKFPYPNNAELFWLGVDPDFHRGGMGKALLDAAVERAKARGCATMTVETLGPSRPDKGYARTRKFYESMGFQPLFELTYPALGNPLQYLLKTL